MIEPMDMTVYFHAAAKEAALATCHRAKCGTVIVSRNGVIIGQGHNSPPNDDETQRMCDASNYDFDKKPKYDKTCCVHAEWNAILDACKRHGGAIQGSTLYFMRIDNDSNFTNADTPFCTVCSRLALQSGIVSFALWDKKPVLYDTTEYNRLSYEFHIGV